MGDNANHQWEWHNTTVGHGYQAKGVIRQRTGYEGESSSSSKVIDLSKDSRLIDDKPEKKSKKDSKKESKKDSKKSSKKHKHHSSKSSSKGKFNPLLQLLATRLSNKTLQFSEMN